MSNQGTILVAEDDRAFRELLLMALEGLGFDAVAAGNAQEMLRVLASRSVDLLLLDLRLGNANGLDILKETRDHSCFSKPPVLLLTACSDQNSVLQAAKLGVNGYILKRELNHADLVARIRHCVEDFKGLPESTDSIPAPATTNAPPSNQAISEFPAIIEIPQEAEDFSSPVSDEFADLEGKLRLLKPIITRAEVLATIDKVADLKVLSPTVTQLLDMTSRPDYSLEQIASVIKRDPSLALKVLKIANSVAYSRAGGVDTVQKALSRVGLAQIRQLILNISVIDGFHFPAPDEYFNGQLFWEHSIATGLIAAAITRFRDCNERAIDAAFTTGLLHDVGRIVFAEQLGDLHKQVAETARRQHLPLEHVELRMLQCHHADLMERMLKSWGFPNHLIEPIALHHLSMANIQRKAPKMIAEIASLALANRLAHAMLLGSTGDECQYSTQEFIEVLGLESDAIAFIESHIPDQTNEVKDAMLESGSLPLWTDHRQMVRMRLKQPVRTAFFGASPVLDGYRIFFERLNNNTELKKPNLAIIHLTDPRDHKSLATKLRESERDAGMPRLPLIVISRVVSPHLDLQGLSDRALEVLPSPFGVPQLIDTMDSLLGARF